MRVYGIKEGSIKTWEEERKRGKIEEFCFIFWVEKMIKNDQKMEKSKVGWNCVMRECVD
jgi:hypothetical protein